MTTANRIMHSRLALLGLVLFSLCIPLSLLIDRQIAFEIENAVVVAISIGIWYGFMRASIDILARDQITPMSGSDALILGVFLTWTALTGLFFTLWAWRIYDDIEIMDHWIGLVVRWLLIIGGILHLSAAGAKGGIIPKASYMKTATVIALGLSLAFALITLGIR